MKKTFVLFIFILTINTLAYAQNPDSIGIRIESREFKCLVFCQLTNLNHNDSISIDDAIVMVRTFNTFFLNRELRLSNSLYGDFYEKFIEVGLNVFIKLLDAKISKGASYYSKKYNLYIGGLPHRNSQYFIILDR